MLSPANPFITTHDVSSGLGPNSLLQDNPLVAIHPPLLYIGFVGFTVPFAFAIGMLATGRVGEHWQIECRRWTLVAFTFLSVGIVLGAWWSYQVLGWGGFWGWDPVGERRPVALAVRDGLPALGARPRAAWAHAGLEPLLVGGHVRADHLGHLLDPLGRHQLGARFLRLHPRADPDRLLLLGGGGGLRVDRLAR